ncbi:MAG: poly-gamma-glutamate biosynthesis protein PgsC [Candidatus Zixiibacteriota bacterium]|nr:MAG: poly-gamma-glutamate biosynthesis protein PgsC [candidate division Zixibacteria bacterium]
MMQSVGLGLVVSLVFSETLGLAAGGMVVPGYMALMIHDPARIAGTIVVSLVTYYTIMLLSNYMFIYGRRRTVMIIIVGFLYGWLSRQFFIFGIAEGASLEFQAIGFIIPGLIANWMERQGIIQTLTTMIVAAVFVRLLLIIFSGGEVIA